MGTDAAYAAEHSTADELVASAGDALSQVAELLSPLDGETAAEASARTRALESRGEGPFVLAVAGDDEPARAAFLNRLLGEVLVDPAREATAGARARFRRGRTYEYRARLRGGREEVFSRRVVDRSQELADAIAMANRNLKEATADVRRLEIALERHAPWLGHAERALPVWDQRVARAGEVLAAAEAERARLADEHAAAREAAEEARSGGQWGPAGWIVGRLLAWASPARARHHQEVATAAEQVAGQLRDADGRAAAAAHALTRAEEDRTRRHEPIANARRQRDELETSLAAARQAREEAERLKAKLEAERSEHVAGRREAFCEAVCALTDARNRADHVETLLVEVPSSAFPDEVILVDLGTRGNMIDLRRGFDLCRRRADGCVWVGGGDPGRDLEAIFLHVTRVPRGADPDSLGRLFEVLGRQRSLAAGRAALDSVRAATAALDQIEVRALAAGRARVERLEALRSCEASALVAKALAQLGGAVTERVELALRHAGDQLAWEIDRLCADWMKLVRACRNVEAVRRLIARLAVDVPIALHNVEREVQARLLAVISGGAHDLHAAATAVIRARLDEAVAELSEPPTPGGSSHHRERLRRAESTLAPVRKALEPAPVQLGVGMQPLARALVGARASALFEGLGGGAVTARLRGVAAVRDDCLAVLRERVVALHKAAEADLLVAEPDVTRLLGEALERVPARAALELDRAVATLARAEAAGLEHDLAHLRGILAGVRRELELRQQALLDRIEALGREIDEILAAA